MALASVFSQTMLGHVRGWLAPQPGKVLTVTPNASLGTHACSLVLFSSPVGTQPKVLQ